jgi:hypothetical protein
VEFHLEEASPVEKASLGAGRQRSAEMVAGKACQLAEERAGFLVAQASVAVLCYVRVDKQAPGLETYGRA